MRPTATPLPDGTDATSGGVAVLRLKIGGMSCSFCVETLKKAAGRLPGVEEVGASLAHEEALVRYDPEQLDPERIRDTVRDLGYTVRDPDKVRTFEEEEAELRRERGRLFLAASFSVASLLLMLFGMWLGLFTVALMPWIMLALAVATMFGPGRYIKRLAWASARRGEASSISTSCWSWVPSRR